MKKFSITRNELATFSLLFISLPVLFAGIVLKSLVIVAGVAGLVIAWFLCIDAIIADHKMNVIKRIFFGSIIVFVPLIFALYLRS